MGALLFYRQSLCVTTVFRISAFRDFHGNWVETNHFAIGDTIPFGQLYHLERTLPINQQIILALEKCLETTPTGSKLLVPEGVPTDKAINQLQQFILRNREAVQDPDSNRPLTFHGLRHTYAAEKYRLSIADSISKLDAHLTVSKLLGHERADVTNIYLVSLKDTL